MMPLFRRKKTVDELDRELDAELNAYVRMLTEEKLRDGMTPDAARRAALLEAGGIEQVKEQVRDMRRGALLDGIMQDVGYALRRVHREPGFFAFAALIIGLGIGASTAVYSVLSPLLLRPLPFPESDRLVWIAQSTGDGLSAVTSRSFNLRDYREMNRSFDGLAGYYAFFEYGSFNLLGDGPPERLVGVGVTQDFLDVLGVRPQLGRSFVDEESVWGGPPAAILTHAFWRRRFNADPGVIGRVITLNSEPTEIVGVLPASFDFASTFVPASRVDFLHAFPISEQTDQWGNTLALIGRLKPGVTVERAQAELDDINARLLEADPRRWGLGAVVSPLRDHLSGEFRTALLLLVAAAAAVLLVACANLSNLLLARGRLRMREMAVRSALGAHRLRLLRQLTIESLILAGCGGVIGVLVAWVIAGAVANASAIPIPLLDAVAVDGRALLFALGITVIAGLLVGLAPMLQLVSGREAGMLNDASRGSTEGRRAASVRDALVIAEVALACVLLVGGGLLLRSFAQVLDTELGFEPSGAVAWRIDTGRPFANHAEAVTFYHQVVEAVRAAPGVDEAGLTDTPPLGRNRGWGIRAKGVVYDEEGSPGVFPRMVDSHYLEVMRIPLIAGRYLTPHDDASSPNVVVINETAARTLFPGGDAVGRTVLVAGDMEWQVIGVVADVRHQSLEQGSGLEVYIPITQAADYFGLTMVVRSSLPLSALASGVRSAIASVDPTLPTGDYQTLTSVVDRSVAPRRFILLVLGGFASAALLLAALGIYAVVSYSVSQRIPEIGIRMALGESAGSVQRSVVRRTLALAGTGVAVGAVLSFIVSRLMTSLLFGVEPTDGVTFAGMAAVLLLVSALAGYLPARRASRVDPMVALRPA